MTTAGGVARPEPRPARRGRAPEAKVGADVIGAVALATLLSVAATLLDETATTILLTPIILMILVFAMARAPLRHSLMALMFVVLVIPSPADVTPSPTWRPPFFDFARVALTHWNSVDRSIGWLSSFSFSGFDLCVLALLVIAIYREQTGSKIDRIGRVPTPRPLVRLAYLSLAGTAFVWLWGMLRGGSFRMSLWQLNGVVNLPILFLLFHLGLRGPKDHSMLARLFLAAAAYKSILAIYIINNVEGPLNPDTGSTKLAFATSHQDSVLFAGALVLVLALVLERAARRIKWILALLLPLVALAIVSNGRRLAWVQVGLVFVVVFALSRKSRLKQRITRTIYVMTPVFIGYLMAGWDSKYSRFFKPVQILRSVVDAQSDSSSFWRELENWNIIYTLKQNPIFGTGYGHGYEEFFAMPAVDYELEHYVPHNSLLGLWCYAGYVGYTCLTLLWAVGVYFAMRAYQKSTDASHRAAALMCFASVLIYMLQCWGDIGLATSTGLFTVAPALAAAGKLAVVTGQWEGGRASSASPPGFEPAPPHRNPVGTG